MTGSGAGMAQGSMPERALLARALFPELAADLDAALAEHGEPSQSAELDSWLDARAAEVRAGAGLDEVVDPGVAARLQSSFTAARGAAGLLGIPLPEPETFLDAGIDIAEFERRLAADASLVPVIAPHGLGPEVWIAAFARVPDEETILVFAREAVREFELLDAVPAGVPTVRGEAGAAWTLRAIPGGPKPAVLGLGFAHGPHPTLPEMLTMQLMRLLGGEPLVDASSFTWLAGSLAGGRLAARHVYDASERTIRITCREIGSQGPHLGARPPVG